MPGNTASITKWGYRKSKGIPLEKQKGTIRCSHCGCTYNGNLAEAQKKFKRHLRKEHPEIQPRSRQEIRRDLDKEKREAKKKREAEEAEARVASRKVKPAVSRPRRTSSQSKTSKESRKRSRVQQPDLTEEMFEKARLLHQEICSIVKVAKHYYLEWGFSSAKALRVILYGVYRERGIRVNIRRGRKLFTKETAKLAKQLRQEGVPVMEIARHHYLEWGYSSLDACRNAVYKSFREGRTSTPAPQVISTSEEKAPA